MEREQWNCITNDIDTRTKLVKHDFLEGKDLLLTNFIKGNYFLKDNKSIINTYENQSKYKFNDNMKTTYSFDNLSDGTYVSDDQLSAITLLSSANDDTESENKHDIFPIDEYSNQKNSNASNAVFITHQLFDINNHNLSEGYKEKVFSKFGHEITNNSSLLKEKSISNSLFFDINKSYNKYNKDDLLDVSLYYNKEKDNDEQNSTKSNYGINDDTYINSDNNENSSSPLDNYLENQLNILGYDEEHYRNLKESDSKFNSYINKENEISSEKNMYGSDISNEETDIDANETYIEESEYEEESEESDDDDVEIIIISEDPTPPPSFFKKMAEIRKTKKVMSNENENITTTINNNNNSNSSNSNSFSSSKRHSKKHKYNRNNHSKYNKGSKSSHCEPSAISIDDYIDHSANSIFSSSNKKKKNNKYHNKSKNSNFVNNNTMSVCDSKHSSNSKNISQSSSKGDNNDELSTSWPSLTSLYLSNNNNTNNNNTHNNKPTKKILKDSNHHTNSSLESSTNTNITTSATITTTVTTNNSISANHQNKNQTSNQNTNEKFSYLSLLSSIKSSSIFNSYPSFVNVKIQENNLNENGTKPTTITNNNNNNENSTNHSPIYGNKNNNKIDNGDIINLNDDKFGQNNIDNETVIQNLENKSIDYIISSKNSTTTVTSVTPSLFFINCPDSVKTKSSHIKKLNFFAQDDNLKEKQEQFNENTLAHIEKSSVVPSIITKKSNLTQYISQSNLIKHDNKIDEVKEEVNISSSNNKDKIKEINSTLDESDCLTSSSLLSSVSYHSSSLLNSSLSYSSSPSTSYSSSLSLSNLEPIPNQLSITSTSQVVVPSPSFSTNSNFSLNDYKDTHSSFNLFNQDLDFHLCHPYHDLNLKCEKMLEISDSEFTLSDSTSNGPFKEINLNHLSTSSEKFFDQNSQTSEDKVSYSYDDDENNLKSSIRTSTILNTKIKEIKSSKEENCVCGCNIHNHYCSYVDHKYKLIREKRRLIKSAINIGFTDIYLKEDLDHEGEYDENSSNCDSSSSPSSSTHSKNKNREEENEKEDIINTILLSHTDFSTFPSHLKFTINTHDVWLRWSNLEFNRNKFKDGRLL